MASAGSLGLCEITVFSEEFLPDSLLESVTYIANSASKRSMSSCVWRSTSSLVGMGYASGKYLLGVVSVCSFFRLNFLKNLIISLHLSSAHYVSILGWVFFIFSFPGLTPLAFLPSALYPRASTSPLALLLDRDPCYFIAVIKPGLPFMLPFMIIGPFPEVIMVLRWEPLPSCFIREPSRSF